MILNILKKQLLTITRNYHHLFLLIGLPIILITILSVSLSSSFNSTVTSIQLKVLFVEDDSEAGQIERFLNELDPDKAKEVRALTSYFQPISILREDVFGSLTDMIDLEDIREDKIEKKLTEDDYTAIIEIPENFTYDILNNLFFDDANNTHITIHNVTENKRDLEIIEQIVSGFQDELTVFNITHKHQINYTDIMNIEERVISDIHSLADVNPISSKQYYTVGMAVMNVLFVATAIGAYAYQEKKMNVFNRILLSNISEWTYFTGVFMSAFLLAFLQLLILFTFSRLVLNVEWGNVAGLLLVTATLSLTVGGIGVLLTAISYRLNSELVTNIFQTVVISIFAFLGGSFFPIGDLSPSIQVLGNLTPNGAALTAYLNMLRENDISMIANELYLLLAFAFVSIIIAGFSFPKRGQSL